MKKCFLLLMAACAGNAMAQQNTDISAEQFNSGSANSTLSALGSQAAASGKQLVVTAPQHWHARIAASIRAGGDADIVLKDGFYETVLVRVAEAAPEPPKPEPPRTPPPPKAVPTPAQPPPPPAASAPAVQPPPPAPAPAPEPAVQAPPPATPTSSEPEAPAEPVAEAPTPVETPAVVDPNAPVMLVGTEPGDTDPVRKTLEDRYNDGKRITELLAPSRLQMGDTIYVGKGAAVIVRREGGRLLRFWLDGSLNLNQIAISADGVNKYKVINSVLQ